MEIIYCTKFESAPLIKKKEERVMTDKGDCIQLGRCRMISDWAQISPNLKELNPADMPIGLVLGSVNGANGCKYMANIMDQLSEIGFRPVLLHYLNFKFPQPDDDVNGFLPIEVVWAQKETQIHGLLVDRAFGQCDKAHSAEVPKCSDLHCWFQYGCDPRVEVAR